MPSPVLPSDADAASPNVFQNICASFKSMFAVGRLFRELINFMFTSTGELSAAFIALIPFPPAPTPTPTPQLKGIPTIFTDIIPGTRTFTVPANVYSLDVEVVGAGGGGSNNAGTGNIGAGGGGYGRKIITVVPGQMISYTVGLGGIVSDPGGVGGDTIFNTTLIGNGGLGGTVAGITTVMGGNYSGADIGMTGWAGGSTWPNNFFPVGGLSIDTLVFLGGRSGHPLSKPAQGSAHLPTFGCGGVSSQPSIGGSPVIVPSAGIAGAVIITYNTWTPI